MPRVIETAAVTFLLVALVGQLLGYPPTGNVDPDGYVSHARAFGVDGVLLHDSHRLPGYPAWLWLLMRLPAPLAHIVSWAQGALFAAFALLSWWWTRRHLGPLVALLLFALLAAPNYLARMSVEMMPDGPYSVLFVAAFLWFGRWATTRGPWRRLIPFGVVLVALQAIRPTTIGLAALFCLSLALVAVAFHRPCCRSAANRAAALFVVAGLAGLLVDRTLDTGARAYNAGVLPPKWALALPPPPGPLPDDDEYIEYVKHDWERTYGFPIALARPGHYGVLPARFFPYARSAWIGRVLAHPGLAVAAVLNDLRWYHYEAALRYTPFWVDWLRVAVWGTPYPPDDGSIEYALFRATGIVLPKQSPDLLAPLAAGLVPALVRLVAVWGLLGLGAWQLARRWPVLVPTWALTAAGFCVFVSATNTLDARYLLPFALPIYLCQAVGLAWVVGTVTGQRSP